MKLAFKYEEYAHNVLNTQVRSAYRDETKSTPKNMILI